MLVIFVVLSAIVPLSYGVPEETLATHRDQTPISDSMSGSFSSAGRGTTVSDNDAGAGFWHPTPSLLSPLLPYSDLKSHSISVDS